MNLFNSDELTKAWQFLLEDNPDVAWGMYITVVDEISGLDNALFLGHYHLISQNHKQAVAELIYAKKLSLENNENTKLLVCLELLTSLYITISDYSAAAENCVEYIDQIQESKQPKEVLLNAFIQLGNVYQNTHNFKEAIANYKRANVLAKQLKNSKQESETLFKIGNSYNWNEELELSEKYLLENIAINKGEGYYNAWSLASLAILYTKQKRNIEALNTFETAISEAKIENDKSLISNISKSLGNLHLIMGNTDKAIEVLKYSIQISEELHLKTVLLMANDFIAKAYEKKGEFDKAYLHFKKYFEINEEIKNANTDIKLKGLQLKFDVDEAKKESELYRLKNIDLVNANNEIERQKQEIWTKKQEITDSIVYAKRIQNSILPELNLLSLIAKEYFVFFKPKDIVSGDFYWIAENEHRIYFAVIDCTGHGVPGAFLSIIANNIFNKAIYEQHLFNTDEILLYVHNEIIHSLNNKTVDFGKDGMDVVLCAVDKNTKELHYSGAYNPLLVFRDNSMIELKPTKFIIGSTLDVRNNKFSVQTLKLQTNDMIYLLSDGFADQFGGPFGKKFKSKKLKSLFNEICHSSCLIQFNELEQIFSDWKGELEQIDDICVMGIKV